MRMQDARSMSGDVGASSPASHAEVLVRSEPEVIQEQRGRSPQEPTIGELDAWQIWTSS